MQQLLFTEPSWPELVRFYDAHHLVRQRPGTQKSRRSAFRHSLAHFGALGVTHPSSEDWSSYLGDRVTGGEIVRATANAHRKYFSHVYDIARDLSAETGWRLLRNPLAAVERWREPLPAPRSMAAPDVTYPLIRDAMPDPIAKAMVSAMRRHGLRLGEALGLEPAHFDLGAGKLRIVQQRAPTCSAPCGLKTDTSAAVLHLHPETAALVVEARRWRLAHPRGASGRELWGRAGARFAFPFFATRCMELLAICREVAPSDFPKRLRGVDGGDGWHVLRHTFAIALIDAGATVEELRELLRQKHLGTTQAYMVALNGRLAGNRERAAQLWEAEAERERAAAARREAGLTLIRGDRK